MSNAARSDAVLRTLWIVLVLNLAVTAIELSYGIWSGSRAIVADGFHSLVDTANNVLGLVMAKIAAHPPDRRHPYGHGKFEVIGASLIGAMILLMVWHTGGDVIANFTTSQTSVRVGREVYGVMAVTLIANAVITIFESRAAKRWQSSLLLADSRHTLADIFVKLGVLVGVTTTQLGFSWADSAAALVVLVFIASIGIRILRRGFGVLADRAAIPVAMIEEIVLAVAGVKGCHHIRSRGDAPYVYVDLVIEVDSALRIAAAHAVASQVELAIKAQRSDVTEVVVHVEPLQDVEHGNTPTNA